MVPQTSTDTLLEEAREAVFRALEIIGAKWTALLIQDMANGVTRFTDLIASYQGLSTRTLALRLRLLEETGVVVRRSYPGSPPRIEYELTDKGRALLPVIREMRKFGIAWTLDWGEPESERGRGGSAGRALTTRTPR